MRVLYVVHQFFPKYISGTEQYVLALARAGRAQGDDVRVFTVDPDWRQPDLPAETTTQVFRGVPVTSHRFDKREVRNHVLADWWNPANGPAFERLLDAFQPEVVHLFHLRFVGIDRLQELERRRIPIVIHLMDFWFACPNFLLLHDLPLAGGGKLQVQCDGPPDGGYGCFDCVNTVMAPWAREPWARGRHGERRAAGEFPANEASGEQAGFAMIERPRQLALALRRADLVIAPSRTVKSALETAGTIILPDERAGGIASGGPGGDWCEVIPYAIDWSLLEGLAPAPTDAVRVGFMGTFAPHKGLAVLLEAFGGLDDRGVKLHCFGRFGDFPDYDTQLAALAAGDPRIEFRGPFEREGLARVLSGLHVLVVPSLWRENTPFVCLEARAAGLDLVVSDLAGMTECLPEGRGRAFVPGDPDSLRNALVEVAAAVRGRGLARSAVERTIPDNDAQYAAFRARYVALATMRR